MTTHRELTEGNILQQTTAKRADITYIASVNGENNNLAQSISTSDRGTGCQCLERCQVGHGCLECLKTCRQEMKQLQFVQPTIDNVRQETMSKRQPCTCNEFCPRTQNPTSVNASRCMHCLFACSVRRKKNTDLPLQTNEVHVMSSDFDEMDQEDGTSFNCLIDEFVFPSNTILSSVKKSLMQIYGGGLIDSNRGCLFDCLPKDMQVQLLHQVLQTSNEDEEVISPF
ncbi:uncharacterized protein [Amphiura filiformis]|uniref:uncharacterized protein n=1 Tax=Amphiura filiformis TaxID=82378 RepID=UPI003B20E962